MSTLTNASIRDRAISPLQLAKICPDVSFALVGQASPCPRLSCAELATSRALTSTSVQHERTTATKMLTALITWVHFLVNVGLVFLAMEYNVKVKLLGLLHDEKGFFLA